MNPFSAISAAVAPYLFWIKVGALVVAVSVIFGAGWKVRDYSCDAAALRVERDLARQETLQLRADMALLKLATETDQMTAAANADRVVELEAASREFESKAGSGVCFDADAADRLRQLWPK